MSVECIMFAYFSKVYFGLFFAGECVQKHDSYMVTCSFRMIIPKKKSIWSICRLGSGYQFDHCECHAHWSYDTTDATQKLNSRRKCVISINTKQYLYDYFSPKMDLCLYCFIEFRMMWEILWVMIVLWVNISLIYLVW